MDGPPAKRDPNNQMPTLKQIQFRNKKKANPNRRRMSVWAFGSCRRWNWFEFCCL
jgi:hypothetical protein